MSVVIEESLSDSGTRFVLSLSLSELFGSVWVSLSWDVVSGKDPLREWPRGGPLFGTGGAA